MRHQAFAIAFITLSASLHAQSISPTVQVTNDYRTQMSKVKKSGVDITVPDSLYKFDYEFDYSVFESPYRGAYEFTPYMMKYTPSAAQYEPRKFFLRAGAGYTLHPELDLVYSPALSDKFTMNIFGNLRGFYGNYSDVGDVQQPMEKYGGHDFSDEAGIEGSVLLKNAQLTFELGHNGAYASLNPWSGASSDAATAYNSGYADVRIKSDRAEDLFFYYDVGARGRYSIDAYKNASLVARELDFKADVSLGVVVRNKYRFLMDANVEFENLEGNLPVMNNIIDLKPHVDFTLGPVNLDAGLKVDFVDSRFSIHPDVHAECSVGSRHVFTVYADLTGGNTLNTYHSLKMKNHRLNTAYAADSVLVSSTKTRFEASLGFRGYASTHFTYNLSGGYGVYEGFLMDSWISRSQIVPDSGYREGVCYAGDYRMAFADASLIWKSERFDAMADVHYRKTLGYTVNFSACELPLLSGDVKLRYNAAGRLFVWVGACGQTERCTGVASGAEEISLPGISAFVDLSAGCEYRFSGKLGFWVKGGNLLGQPVRHSLLYLDESPFVSAGITLGL